MGSVCKEPPQWAKWPRAQQVRTEGATFHSTSIEFNMCKYLTTHESLALQARNGRQSFTHAVRNLQLRASKIQPLQSPFSSSQSLKLQTAVSWLKLQLELQIMAWLLWQMYHSIISIQFNSYYQSFPVISLSSDPLRMENVGRSYKFRMHLK